MEKEHFVQEVFRGTEQGGRKGKRFYPSIVFCSPESRRVSVLVFVRGPTVPAGTMGLVPQCVTQLLGNC